jgi:transcriptional regulator with XRE-family HTH domain
MFLIVKTNAYEHFIAAFQRLISERERGTQRKLAKFLNMSPENVNHVLRQRKRASQELQEAIARFFVLTYDEMLSFGRKISESRTQRRVLPFQDELDRYPEVSKERYLFIYRKACEQLGGEDLYFAVKRAIESFQGEFQAYSKGKLDDFTLFHSGKEKISSIQSCILEVFETWSKPSVD